MRRNLAIATACAAFGLAHGAALTADGGNFLSAIGLGMTDRQKSSKFYEDALGFTFLDYMEPGDYVEDILTNNGGGSTMVIMKWNDDRSTHDLPFKLQYWCNNPKESLEAIVKAGGKIDEMKTEANPDALYGRDLDGYLLELLKVDPAKIGGNTTLSTPCILGSLGVGVSDLNKAAAFWSKALGAPAGPVKTYKEWSSIAVTPAKNSEILLISWNESPKRPTANLPYKIVIGAESTTGFAKQVKAAGGKVTSDPALLFGAIGFAEDPTEQNVIEINDAAIGLSATSQELAG